MNSYQGIKNREDDADYDIISERRGDQKEIMVVSADEDTHQSGEGTDGEKLSVQNSQRWSLVKPGMR